MTEWMILTIGVGIGLLISLLRGRYRQAMLLILLSLLVVRPSMPTSNVRYGQTAQPKQWPSEEFRYNWWDMEITGCTQ